MENNLNIKNYVDDSENEKLLLKVSKLEIQIKKLSSENNNMKAKLNNLERTLEIVCTQLKIKTYQNFDIKNQKEETAVEETWLYYVKKNKTSQEIISSLSFESNAVVIDIKVDNWNNENKLLIDLLNCFPKFKEFSEDWSSMTNKQLAHFLQTILSSSLVCDTVVILRNLPVRSNNNYDSVMSNISTVAEIMYTTWEELEINNEVIGKMALILESEEELQILNIIKNNSRSILIVESLFND